MSLLLSLIVYINLFININGRGSNDIGCNYVNSRGIAMPIGYCMQIIYNNYKIAAKWACNDTWNGVNMEIYASTNCEGRPFYVESYTDDVTGFVCKEEYDTINCNEVSINAYEDNECDGDEFSELRLIADECIYYDDDIYIKLECTADTATISMYDTLYGNCSDDNLMNTTALTEGSLEGENAGCIAIEGCSLNGAFSNNSLESKIIGYIVMILLILVFIAIIIVFSLRYLHKKKMNAINNVSAVPSITHSGKKIKNKYDEIIENEGENLS